MSLLFELKPGQKEIEKKLSVFFREFKFQALAEIETNRFDSFSAIYKKYAEKFKVFYMQDNDEILGVASFIFKKVKTQGHPKTVAFGRDLRISNNRKAVTGWSQHFLPIMKKVQDSESISYFFSVLSLSEAQALNAFVRPRSIKRRLPLYHLYRRFSLVSIHGKFPWAAKALPFVKVKSANPSNREALINYIIKKSELYELATVFSEESFDLKIQLLGKDVTDFLIAFDSQNQICGCTLLLSHQDIQEFVPLKYGLRAHNFRQFLKFGRFLGWTRSLTKPFSRTHVHNPLAFKSMSFLYADNKDIFASLVQTAFDRVSTDEFLVYSRARAEFMKRPPEGWVAAEIPFGLYLVNPPDSEIPSFMHATHDELVELEPFDLV